MLFEQGQYELAQKYYEELAHARKKAEYYLYLLKCRIKAKSLSTAIFNLTINPNDDASQKKPSELDLDEVLERIIVCEFDENLPEIRNDILQMVLYQIRHNTKNAKDHIETVISCYTHLGANDLVEKYLFEISNKYIQINDFKSAQIYYNEILTHNTNCSKAHWGLLKCKLKAFDDADLAKVGKKLMKYQEFTNATNCANNAEYEHYMTIYNGTKQFKNNRPNRKAYLDMTKIQRWFRNAVIAILLVCLIGASVFTIVGIANPITYDVSDGKITLTGTGFFFDYVVDDLEVNKIDDMPVIAIGEGAFSNKPIRTLIIGESIQTISSSAFENCAELTEVVIKGDKIHIEKQAFSNCAKLSSVVFENPQILLYLGDSAFQNCSNLETITLNNVQTIDVNSFAGCSKLNEIVINSTEDLIIAEGAFADLSDGCKISFSTETGDLYLSIAVEYPNLNVIKHTKDVINECIYLINKIGTVSLDSADAITLAKTKFDSLTNEQKALVSNAQVLNDAISDLKVLQTIAAIDNIAIVSAGSEDLIKNAESLYNVLSVSEKAEVTNISSLLESRKIFDIIKMIDTLDNTATEELLEATLNIRTFYDTLTEEQQAKIVNRDKLFAAESDQGVFSVISAIDRIGVVSLDSEDAIVLAERAYNQLSDSQKSDVTNLNKLTTTRSVFDVMIKINQIGAVTLDNESPIISAEESYALLNAEQQSMVSNKSAMISARQVFDLMTDIENLATITLESEDAISQCETTYSSLSNDIQLQIINADKLTSARQVYDVLKQIDSLGIITLESESAISAAENAYSQLSNTQKNAISNYSTLTSARSTYDVLFVEKLINDIGTVSLSSKNNIETAETAYGDLTYTQKNQVTNYNILVEARSAYDVLYVIDAIDTIGTVTLESKEKIIATEQLYADLSETEKEQINNYSTLVGAREKYDVLLTIDTIGNIGSVTLQSETQIVKAEEYYEKLSSEQKAQITNYAVLTEARREFDVLATIQSINDIGTVTQNSWGAINKAESAYNNLDGTQKAQIDNVAILNEAKEYYNYLKQFKFTLNQDDTYSIAAASTNTDCFLVIPSEYDGKAVTQIEDYGFRDCNNMLSVTIPSSITWCGGSAFYDCYKLVEAYKLTSAFVWFENDIDIYTSLDETSKLTISNQFIFYESKGEYYLMGYTGNATNLVLPEKYNNEYYTIYQYAFYNNKTIKTLSLPILLKDIQHCAFEGCSGLSSVCLPAGALCTGSSIFNNCNLSSYSEEFDYFWGYSDWSYTISPHMSNGNGANGSSWLVNNIQTNAEYDYVISGDKAILTKYKGSNSVVSVPSTIDGYTVIGISTAFVNRTSITSITLPDTIEILNHYAFAFCENLKTVSLPSSLSYIGSYAFYSCTNLTEINIPENTNYIGEYAFNGCSKLTTINYQATNLQHGVISRCGSNAIINISPDVQALPANIFSGLTVKTVVFEANSICESIGSSAFNNCDSLTTIILPASLKVIEDNAFYGCGALTEITIPASVNKIGSNAFASCSVLNSVYFEDFNGWKRQDNSVTLSISSTLLADASSAANTVVTQYAQYALIKE